MENEDGSVAGITKGLASASLACQGSKRVTLHLRVPYFTEWGQNLVMCGAGGYLSEIRRDGAPTMPQVEQSPITISIFWGNAAR